mgnify:CR=1 FL=1
MNARAEALGITPDLLLDVFDTPVTFHRCLVPVAGGGMGEGGAQPPPIHSPARRRQGGNTLGLGLS